MGRRVFTPEQNTKAGFPISKGAHKRNISGGRLILGLLNGCFWVLAPTAEMPRVVWEVLSRLGNHMR